MKWAVRIFFIIFSVNVSAQDFQSKNGIDFSFAPYPDEPGGIVVASVAGSNREPVSIDVIGAELTYVEMSSSLVAVVSASEAGKHFQVIYFLSKNHEVTEIADLEYDYEYSPDVGDIQSSVRIMKNNEGAWSYVDDVDFKDDMPYLFLPVLSDKFSKPSKYYMHAIESETVKNSLYLNDAYIKKWGGSLCGDSEVTILSCRTKLKSLALCAGSGNSILYKYGRKGDIEISLLGGNQSVVSNNYIFHNGEYEYRVTVNGDNSGLLLVRNKGKEIYKTDCKVSN
ncbi:hypothetical protein ACKC9G_12915 [Pokkaliibacter sp. CJK22405]|uniref:hypothetical protein n=1 Tax=Pokkaliibacter sp. CJK22405 TaxID=3384615 RepID=UPI0039850B74